MKNNIRLGLSFLWFIACGCVAATALYALVTWGDHLDYLYASLALWCIATFGTLVTSL